MDETDQSLEKFIREWATSHDSSCFKIVTKPETKGGPMSFHIQPVNPKSTPISLYVSDDGASVSFSFGIGSWWDGGIPLESAAVQNLLDTVAAGRVEEQVGKLFGHTVALRGAVGTPGADLRAYSQINIFAIMPGVKWEAISYQPYFLVNENDA